MKQPPSNQFICRAYLCQAQLMAPANANSSVGNMFEIYAFEKKRGSIFFLFNFFFCYIALNIIYPSTLNSLASF